MIQAILHGKGPRENRRSEDVLTSNVFGLLSCLDWSEGLGPWLAGARRLDGQLLGPIAPGKLTFWPYLALPGEDEKHCEPDLLIEHDDGSAVFIECKLWSGASGQPTTTEDEEVRGQLGRQWRALRHGWSRDDAEGETRKGPGLILYVTRDWRMPRETLGAMIREIEDKTGDPGLAGTLYWLSWRSLAHVLGTNPDPSTVGRRLQAMLVTLLERMELVAFDGVRKPRTTSVSWTYGYGLCHPRSLSMEWAYRGGE